MTKKIPVLMFHNISEIKGEKSSVFHKDFYNQIKYLTNLGYKCVNLRNLEDNEFNKKIIITFDDGYENIYKLAMPILNEFNQKATCFIVKNQIDGFNLWDSNRNDYKKHKLINLSQIQEWDANGFEIGSHSLDHLNLTEQTSDIKLGRKIKYLGFSDSQKLKLYDDNELFIGIGESSTMTEILPKRLFV